MIMEAEKSHNLPSVSWKPRNAGDLVQRHKNQRADGVFLQVYVWKPEIQEHQGQEKNHCSYQPLMQRERASKLFLSPNICYIQALKCFYDAHSHVEGNLVNSVYQIKC